MSSPVAPVTPPLSLQVVQEVPGGRFRVMSGWDARAAIAAGAVAAVSPTTLVSVRSATSGAVMTVPASEVPALVANQSVTVL
ncbi:MAG: hypothetical protein MUE41_17230 [Gemmatimonadaceae bacterium]|nr:hypothetical protein [Gemmatimonadaceae bacterium]